MQPDVVQVLLALGAGDGPGASLLALGVLPLGLYSLLEHMHVTFGHHLRGRDDVIVQAGWSREAKERCDVRKDRSHWGW